MADYEFYDVKTRNKVKVAENKIKKTTYKTSRNQTRYAIRAEHQGRPLTRFVKKDLWDRLKVPTE